MHSSKQTTSSVVQDLVWIQILVFSVLFLSRAYRNWLDGRPKEGLIKKHYMLLAASNVCLTFAAIAAYANYEIPGHQYGPILWGVAGVFALVGIALSLYGYSVKGNAAKMALRKKPTASGPAVSIKGTKLKKRTRSGRF